MINAATSDTPSQPLRGELFSIDHLRNHALQLANELKVVPRQPPNRRFFRQFQHNSQQLQAAYRIVTQFIRSGELMTPDVEWLLDNFYVVEEQLYEIQQDLPPAYFRELPKLSDGNPRVLRLAEELIFHTDSVVLQADLTAFVNDFQQSEPLTIGELWAFPIMLRISLVENLGRLAAQSVESLRQSAAAKELLRAWQIGEPLPEPLQHDRPPPELVAHAYRVASELFHDDPGRSAALEQVLADRFPQATELLNQEHRRQAANQVSIGNVITSMRLISALDWAVFFEGTSVSERILRSDPAGVYSQMDLETRTSYRTQLERLSKRSSLTEAAIARIAIEKAQQSVGDQPAIQSHVGYWLIDEGRRELERELRFRPTPSDMLKRALRAFPQTIYFGLLSVLIATGTFAMASIAFSAELSWWSLGILMLMAVVPISELAVLLVNLVITHCVPPRRLPKLEFPEGVPEACRAFVVVPAMLGSRREVESLLERLELHYVSNPERELHFALLTDFTDATSETTEADAELVGLAVAGVRKLNAKYSGTGRQPFFFFHRARRWNPCEQAWMGWERKRGKLTEFNRLLHGASDTSYAVLEGDLSILRSSAADPAVPFVITLDADTQLPLGTARRLIGTLAHPLNRPFFTQDGQCVKHGYSILQPRVSVQLKDANKSRFAQLFASGKGLDPYITAASDVYQDLFGEGSFTGKGIYDVRAFERSLHQAFGENQILSHDLIEGCHARVGLVSDIEVIDGFPSRYDAEIRRQHRWTRGDWQIMPWLFDRVPSECGSRPNRLSLLSRWKIFDNLRRSLVAPATGIMLLTAWFAAPEFAAVWCLAAWSVLGWPVIAAAVGAIVNWPRWRLLRPHLHSAAVDLVRALGQTGVQAACLPHKACVMTDAIARTLVRMGVTRRKMLEWETAAATETRLRRSNNSIVRQMAFVPGVTAVISLMVPPAAWPSAAPWLILWALSPWIAHFISLPLKPKRQELTAADKQWLRLTARNTWSYFETYVNSRTNWLPPDNFQEYPEEKLAERISPTNEGLFLVSVLVARDFGFLGLNAVADLWEKNLAVWRTLPQHHGHFYNWYDTATLTPLMPRYVSTVDSGNLAASLLVVKQGIDELCRNPVFRSQTWEGLLDTVTVAVQSCDRLQPRGARIVSPLLDDLTATLKALTNVAQSVPRGSMEFPTVLTRLKSFRAELAENLASFVQSHRDPSGELERKTGSVLAWIDSLVDDATTLVPWCEDWSGVQGHFSDQHHPLGKPLADVLESAQTLEDFVRLPDRVLPLFTSFLNESNGTSVPENGRDRIADLQRRIRQGAEAAKKLHARLCHIAQSAEQLALGMNFEFLYNPQRRLFAIGFNLEDGRLDRSHYDMLCSEARLSSHIAIAKGDVEFKHWFHLGRQLTFTAGQPGLLSWGGTMFEFLMPLLFQRYYDHSLLAQACDAAVARQQEYGRQRGVPWGISESAFATLAANSDYCYQSFGVPGLGLKRGLSEDLVIAPYATMLALPLAPRSALLNLQALEKTGALGSLGFYDAIDFTPLRVPPGRGNLPVRCYMAHHQAMSLLAIANVLRDFFVERRFHRHPLIRATEMLLEEVVPTAVPVLQPHVDEVSAVPSPLRQESALVSRRIMGFESRAPLTQLLSNGSYSVMVTNTGGGYSRCGEISLNRWRPDAVKDAGGQFIYLRDCRTDRVWSATYQPTCEKPDAYEVIYSIDKAEFRRQDGTLETHLEIAVCPDSDVEIRQLTITNRSRRFCEIEITSYAEVSLATPAADLAHPAFQKLFVETEYVPEATALLAKRRPRESHVAETWGVHVLTCPQATGETVQYESSRERFLGRGRDVRNPAALAGRRPLSGTSGLVLDPVFSLRCRVQVAPLGTVRLSFSTGMTDSREAALKLADQFHEPRNVQRAFELAWVFNQVQLQQMHLTAAEAHRAQRLAAGLLFCRSATRGDTSSLLKNHQSQSGLWRYGISGDKPILLVKADEPKDVEFVSELLMAREYWHNHGLDADLVILNVHPGSYLDALQEQLQRAVHEAPRVGVESKKSIFLLRASQLPDDDLWLLEAAAQVVLEARQGWTPAKPDAEPTRPDELEKRPKAFESPPPRQAVATSWALSNRALSNGAKQDFDNKLDDLEFWNGLGGFLNSGREYCIRTDATRPTPAPWSNVIANPRIGCLVTESGGGFTWVDNSRQNKLTTWSNDPVSDPPSEILYLTDRDTGAVRFPLSAQEDPNREGWVDHGQGYTRFRCCQDGLEVETVISIAEDEPVKFVCVKLRNAGYRQRRLSVTYYAELVLGVCREQTQMHLVSEVDSASGALLVRNAYRTSFAEQVVFLNAIGPNRSLAGDRAAFLGRNGHWKQPLALTHSRLTNSTGAGLDPCGAVQTSVTLAEGETTEVAFLLGAGGDVHQARTLLNQFRDLAAIHEAVSQTRSQWDSILSTVQVKTPNRALDLLVNRWLPYQVLSCRFWGRSAFYQSGGAYGFRDQLQDAMALVYMRPDLVRAHLLRAAARQYEDGGVQHWWHTPDGAGTRTRFSDDFLWLPFCTAHYVLVTADESVLEETVPYLHSPPLDPDVQERYEVPRISSESGTLFDHCLKALDHGMRTGEHGLPLIGCGDWNDGFSQIGILGRGESVWVGWFLLVLLDQFLPLMECRGETEQIERYRQFARDLRAALEQHAWDGQWYRRAYFDDGSPLGSHRNDECRIDSIAQSWAVLAHADESRTDSALEAVFEHLVIPKDRLVKLLSPPFDKTEMEPGYIKGYLPGVRENGGQYTHAVLWLIQALAAKADGARAMEIFDLINPIWHTNQIDGVHRYRSEPYVVAADVYSVPPHAGRGGWTWYTGSASWMYRVALENLLGITIRGRRITFLPCLPDGWSEYEFSLQIGSSTWRFNVHLKDDADQESKEIELIDDGQAHRCEIYVRNRCRNRPA